MSEPIHRVPVGLSKTHDARTASLDRFEHDAAVKPENWRIMWTAIPVGPEAVVSRILFRTPKRWTWGWLKLEVGHLVCRVFGHRAQTDPDGAGDYCSRCRLWVDQ